MDIGENISDSIRYPLNDWVKILILTVISLIPIVNIMSAGYYLRIIKSTIAGIDEVPDFDDLGELFIDGIKIIVVGIVYMIVPIIIFILAGLLASPGTALTTGLSLVLMIIGFVITLILGIIYVVAIANMALYDSELGAAFRFNEILDRINAIGWADYLIWYIVIALTSMVIGLVIGIIGFILIFILVGFLVLLAGGSYLLMFQGRSLALLFRSSVY
jgi:hypothetical protein